MSKESDKFLASVIVDAMNGEWKVSLMEIGKLRMAFKNRNEREVTKMVALDLIERSPHIAGDLLDALKLSIGKV